MPLIYTYPTVSPASEDLVLLTDTSDSSKATKTATVSSLLSIGLAQDINTAKVSLSASDLANLWQTPVTIVGSPGAGKYISALTIEITFNYTAPQYTTDGAGDLELKYATANGKLVINDWGVSSVPWTGVASENKIIPNTFSGLWGENEALQLAITGGTANSLTGGGGTANIYVTYKIVTI